MLKDLDYCRRTARTGIFGGGRFGEGSICHVLAGATIPNYVWMQFSEILTLLLKLSRCIRKENFFFLFFSLFLVNGLRYLLHKAAPVDARSQLIGCISRDK